MSTLDCKSRIRIYDSTFYQKIHRKNQKTKIVCNFFQFFCKFFFGFLRVFACRKTLQKFSKLFFFGVRLSFHAACAHQKRTRLLFASKLDQKATSLIVPHFAWKTKIDEEKLKHTQVHGSSPLPVV